MRADDVLRFLWLAAISLEGGMKLSDGRLDCKGSDGILDCRRTRTHGGRAAGFILL